MRRTGPWENNLKKKPQLNIKRKPDTRPVSLDQKKYWSPVWTEWIIVKSPTSPRRNVINKKIKTGIFFFFFCIWKESVCILQLRNIVYFVKIK